MHANVLLSSQVHDFQKEIKTYLGKDGAPQDAPAIVAKWFTLFQAILERNDDNDVQTDEYMYGKVSFLHVATGGSRRSRVWCPCHARRWPSRIALHRAMLTTCYACYST